MFRFLPLLLILCIWIISSTITGIYKTQWIPLPLIGGFIVLFLLSPWVIIINSILHRMNPHKTSSETIYIDDRQDIPRNQENSEQLLQQKQKNPNTINSSNISNIETPRILVANFECSTYIDETNRTVSSIKKQGISGTGLFTKGNWDFAMVGLTTLLWKHGNKTLSETATNNILSLLPEGGIPKTKVYYTLGRVFDTENHILMHVSSQYLANFYRHHINNSKMKKHNNNSNGLKEWLLGYLQHIRYNGFYEFNSIPYESYALHSILNLAGFADTNVKTLAITILDERLERFCYSSFMYRHSGPFRRQLKRTDLDKLERSRILPLVDLYTGKIIRDNGDQLAEMACCIPYIPPKHIIDSLDRNNEYFYTVLYGHGLLASPEIYSGGPGYTLCAGGVYRGMTERIVNRSILLLLNDNSVYENDCFHIKGKNNNTGVYNGFAVGKGKVHIPSDVKPIYHNKYWNIYKKANCVICVGSGCFVVYPENDVQNVKTLLEKLPTMNNTTKEFQDPIRKEIIKFQTNSWRFLWVITNKDNRFFDFWNLYQKQPKILQNKKTKIDKTDNV